MTEDARERAIQGIMKNGKTRAQAIAFLDLMGSAFRRKGWAEGEPLASDEISERLDTFLGRES